MDAAPWKDDVLLLTPGPTPLHPRAAAALTWPMRGHMDPDVLDYNDRVVADLRDLFGAAPDAFTCLLGGSGSLGMEAGFANLLEPGDAVVVGTNGVFGERMAIMAERLGAKVHRVAAPAGEALDPARWRAAIHQVRPKLVAFVHGETSTGVLNPVAPLAAAAHEVGALLSVDAVTTVGMLPFDMVGWGVDYAYTGSQKCLSAPPGLAPVAVSRRAMAAVGARRTPVVTWYADLLGTEAYWAVEGGHRYHHTVPTHLHWATGEAIRAALVEGVAARSERARRTGAAVLAAFATVGFGAFVPAAVRLPTVLSVRLPEGLDDAAVRRDLRDIGRVSLAGGLGATAGTVWRLGLMGESARREPYRTLMVALAQVLPAYGIPDAVDLPAAFDAAWVSAAPMAAHA